MALCNGCKQDKQLTEFYLRKNGKPQHLCKPCWILDCKVRREANLERYLELNRQWKLKNRDRHIANSSRWNRENRLRRLEILARYRANSKDKIAAYAQEYNQRYDVKAKFKERKIARRVKGPFCPVWANRKVIANLYREARRLTKETGLVHSVDHIVPVKNKLVCGLHVEANLRVIPQAENLAKGNRWWPGMPET
jgi:hypothetical protein